MKYCGKCKLNKPKSEFYKDKSKRDSLTSRCKSCQKKYYDSEHSRNIRKKYEQSENRKNARKKFYESEVWKEANRRSQKRTREKHPQRIRVRTMISHAVKRKKMKPARDLSCHDCRNPAEQYHHHKGYSPEHALNVIPLCRECHMEKK